jgi:hypothetical protein
VTQLPILAKLPAVGHALESEELRHTPAPFNGGSLSVAFPLQFRYTQPKRALHGRL